MSEKEIQKLKDTLWANTWSNEEIIDEGIATLKQSLEYKEEGFRRVESAGLLTIYTLQQENQQLKEQLNQEKDDFKEFIKLGDKELKESINNLKGTEFLDAFCVLQWINTTRKENKQLKEQLKQRDEVIEKISRILNKHRFEENDDYYDYSEQGICITGWDDDYNELNNLLQKYKGDNNE